MKCLGNRKQRPSRRERYDPWREVLFTPKTIVDPRRAITPYPYRWSEVIHQSGAKAPKRALERERAQIVNNFAQGASATTNDRPIR